MVNVKNFVLVVPVLAQPPPLVTLQPLLAVAAKDSGAFFRAQAFETESTRKRQEQRPKPRPEQGGEAITEAWLLTETDTGCLWRFR
jgi:hypothetical protein